MTSDSRRDHVSFDDEALRWLPDVMRFALSLTRDRSSAEDLVQDTFLSARRSWHQFEPGSDGKAWLFTICRHRFYRLAERAGRQVDVEDAELESLASASLAMGAAPAGIAPDTVDVADRSDLRTAIRRAMHALPPAFRDVAILVDWHDQSYETAAQILDVPIGTVRSRLFRARRILQEQLIEHARDAGFVTATDRRPATGSRP